MNWLGFGWDSPKVKGQWTWSKYANFTSLTQNLKNPWVDFLQTWYRGAPPGVDELIRIWARSAQGQRSKVGLMDCNCEGYRKDRVMSEAYPSTARSRINLVFHEIFYHNLNNARMNEMKQTQNTWSDPLLILQLQTGRFCTTLSTRLPGR